MKQIIIMRKDLNMRKGKMIAQGAHASTLAILGNINHKNIKEWASTGSAKIVVSVDSEEELLEIYNKAKSKLDIHYLVKDAGRTEFNGIATLTCAAIGPDKDELIDSITGHLSLL